MLHRRSPLQPEAARLPRGCLPPGLARLFIFSSILSSAPPTFSLTRCSNKRVVFFYLGSLVVAPNPIRGPSSPHSFFGCIDRYVASSSTRLLFPPMSILLTLVFLTRAPWSKCVGHLYALLPPRSLLLVLQHVTFYAAYCCYSKSHAKRGPLTCLLGYWCCMQC